MSDGIHIDLATLRKATSRLSEALQAYAATPENLFILDSVIKRFELTYLQTIRVMERFLEDHAPIDLSSGFTFRELMESATEYGLTEIPFEKWLEFRKARNKTAHTYVESELRDLTKAAGEFLPVSQTVLDNVERRVSADE